MARGVYFSFHYDDVTDFRVNVVRNSRALLNTNNTNTFIDKSLWEEAAKKDFKSLEKLISEGLKGCSVTAILVGLETAERRWVKFEIVKSFTEGKGIFVTHINRIKTRSESKITRKGNNPLERLKVLVDSECKNLYFYELVNRKWIPYVDLPSIGNRKSNAFYFQDGGWFTKSDAGKEFKFSELFKYEYCWVQDNGYLNFTEWVENAANEVGR